MESYPDRNRSVRAFNLRSRTPEFLPEVLPLLEADYGWDHLKRVSDTKEELQLHWQKGEDRDEKYAILHMTLSKSALSLIIAMDYRLEDQPVNMARSTFVIHQSSYPAFHSVHRHNMVQLNHYEFDEAVDNFKIEFNNTLIGLGYREAPVEEAENNFQDNRFSNTYEQEEFKLAS